MLRRSSENTTRMGRAGSEMEGPGTTFATLAFQAKSCMLIRRAILSGTKHILASTNHVINVISVINFQWRHHHKDLVQLHRVSLDRSHPATYLVILGSVTDIYAPSTIQKNELASS
jgi:hypothetical protein